jgi:ketosteroid isomerase-like protein
MPSNVEIARALSEPFAEVNVAALDWRADAIREALASTYTEDTELHTLESGGGLGIKTFYSGLDGMVDYLSTWLEPFDQYQIEWLDFLEAGDFVLVPSSQWGIGKTSGARVELDLTYLLQMRDRKIARTFQYDTLEQARAAAAELAAKP